MTLSGTDYGGDDCCNIVWSTTGAENIVWGTNCSGDYDNIVWCTAVVPMSPGGAIRARSSATTPTCRVNQPVIKA